MGLKGNGCIDTFAIRNALLEDTPFHCTSSFSDKFLRIFNYLGGSH